MRQICLILQKTQNYLPEKDEFQGHGLGPLSFMSPNSLLRMALINFILGLLQHCVCNCFIM
jgi:hypothetical protein